MNYKLFQRYRPLTDAEIRMGEQVTKWMRVTVIVEVVVIVAVIAVAFGGS